MKKIVPILLVISLTSCSGYSTCEGEGTLETASSWHECEGRLAFKGYIYEGGFRVPFAIQWKGTLNKSICNYPVSSLDILGTIADLTKVERVKRSTVEIHLKAHIPDSGLKINHTEKV